MAQLGFWEWDPASDDLYWSDGLFRIYGLPPSDRPLSVETFLEHVHPEDRERTRACIQRALEELEPFAFEERIVRPDGEVRLLRSSGEVLSDGERRPERVIGICQDITAIRATEERALRLAAAEAAQEEARRTSERLLRLLTYASDLSRAHSSGDVADAVLGSGLEILEADRGAIGLLTADGARLEPLAWRGYDQGIVETIESLSMHTSAHVTDAIRTGQAVWVGSRQEYRDRYPELFARFGEQLSDNVAALPLEAGEEGVFGALMVGFQRSDALGIVDRALTRLVAFHAAGALARALEFDAQRRERQTAEAAARAREEALAVVVHDLRQPLNAVTMAADLLRGGEVDDDQRADLLRRSQRAVSRMNALVADLLDSARIEAGRFSIEPAPLHVPDLLEEAAEGARADAHSEGVRVDVVVDACDETIMADRQRLLQALGNLLANAVTASPDGGTIRLRAEVDDDGITMRVEDEGPGIEGEAREHLFDPYWSQRESRDSGTGLGLPIARGVVEAHDGRIWLDSESEDGATICFMLPRDRRS